MAVDARGLCIFPRRNLHKENVFEPSVLNRSFGGGTHFAGGLRDEDYVGDGFVGGVGLRFPVRAHLVGLIGEGDSIGELIFLGPNLDLRDHAMNAKGASRSPGVVTR